MYANNNRHYLPYGGAWYNPVGNPITTPTQDGWAYRLLKNTQGVQWGGPNDIPADSYTPFFNFYNGARGAIYLCPLRYTGRYGWAGMSFPMRTYYINNTIVGMCTSWANDGVSHWQPRGTPLSRIRRSSTKVLLIEHWRYDDPSWQTMAYYGDSFGSGNGFGGYGNPANANAASPPPHSRGKYRNYLFADMHVESVHRYVRDAWPISPYSP